MDIQRELDRRRPGQSRITTQRNESDTIEILSGLSDDGFTLGTSIAMLVRNQDTRSRDYDEMRTKYRPSHADYTYQAKYGIRAWQGGGRASARETIARVAAGAIARKLLAELWSVDILACVVQVKDIVAELNAEILTRDRVESSPIRCPDESASSRMFDLVDAARKSGDSVGGVIHAVARGVPPGWGDPVFDKLDADLAKAMISLPAAKGFEIGGGFQMTHLFGSEANDAFRRASDGRIRTRSNFSGGIQGGITNGEEIWVRVAFKPTATILREQDTVDMDGNETTLAARGRHDPCVLPRAVPIVESMMALVLIDHALRQRGQCG